MSYPEPGCDTMAPDPDEDDWDEYWDNLTDEERAAEIAMMDAYVAMHEAEGGY